MIGLDMYSQPYLSMHQGALRDSLHAGNHFLHLVRCGGRGGVLHACTRTSRIDAAAQVGRLIRLPNLSNCSMFLGDVNSPRIL